MREKRINKLYTTVQFILITMVTFWANKKRDTFQESETSMNPLITWRDKAVTQSMILSSEESEVTFVTEDIILCIGWVSV